MKAQIQSKGYSIKYETIRKITLKKSFEVKWEILTDSIIFSVRNISEEDSGKF